MTSAIILSDNGVSSGSAGVKSSGGNDGTLLLQTTTSGGTATTAVAIDTSQNVGVGTTTPAAKLQVNGAIRTTYSADTSYYGTFNNATGAVQVYANGDSAPLLFGTTSAGGSTATERARIDSSGSLLVGTTNNSGLTGKVTISGSTVDNNLLSIKNTITTYNSSQYFAGFFNSTNGVAGSIQHTAVTTVNYGTSSDARLKENIVDAPSALTAIDNVKVRSFDWKIDGLHIEYGFIAQELNEVFPTAVCPGDSEEELTNPKGTWQVDYGKITPLLVKAIQEQQALITNLTERLVALEGK